MLFVAIWTLYAGTVTSAAIEMLETPLILAESPQNVPGGSLVKLCPESGDGDVLAIERIVNKPQTPYL